MTPNYTMRNVWRPVGPQTILFVTFGGLWVPKPYSREFGFMAVRRFVHIPAMRDKKNAMRDSSFRVCGKPYNCNKRTKMIECI